MAAGGDARRAVDVAPDVPLLGKMRGAGMNAHAHRDRELRLRLGRSLDRAWRRRERDEEGIALRVHLDAAVTSERIPKYTPVLGERGGVPLGTELVQELRRTLDIGEEERHGAGGEGPHSFREEW